MDAVGVCLSREGHRGQARDVLLKLCAASPNTGAADARQPVSGFSRLHAATLFWETFAPSVFCSHKLQQLRVSRSVGTSGP